MPRIMTVIGLLLICLSAAPTWVFAVGNPELTQTAGRPNGRLWRSLPYETKIMFLVGFDAGTRLALDFAKADRAFAINIAEHTRQETAEELDKYFSDPANAPVPIEWARIWVAKKFSGGTSEELAGFAALLRKMVSDPRFSATQRQ